MQTTKYAIRKGATFVQYQPRHAMIFMIVNEVKERINTRTICSVTWYMLDAHGINIQRHFGMAAFNDEFANFKPIEHRHFREIITLMRLCDTQLRATDTQEAKILLAKLCRRRIITKLKRNEEMNNNKNKQN